MAQTIKKIKNLTAMWETWASIPELGRSPGGGRGKPLSNPCLENPHGTKEPGGLQSME